MMAQRDERAHRLSTVYLLPTTVLGLFLLALVASRVPGREQTSPVELLAEADRLSLGAIALALLAIVVVALVTQPFQPQLVKLLEGYWGTSTVGRALTNLGVELHRRRRQRLKDIEQRGESVAGAARWSQMLADLSDYSRESRLMPTALGNTLRAAEDRAGPRYGLATVATMPRLFPHLSEPVASGLRDTRNQLDTAVRFCAVFALATPISAATVYCYPAWLTVPAGTALLTWLSYRAAVRAARQYGQVLYIAFDLHRFDMLKALHYPLPATLDQEKAFNDQLSRFFTTLRPIKAPYEHPGSEPVETAPMERSGRFLALVWLRGRLGNSVAKQTEHVDR